MLEKCIEYTRECEKKLNIVEIFCRIRATLERTNNKVNRYRINNISTNFSLFSNVKTHVIFELFVQKQREIFESYYNLLNWSQKTVFLLSLVDWCIVKKSLNPISFKNRDLITPFRIQRENI